MLTDLPEILANDDFYNRQRPCLHNRWGDYAAWVIVYLHIADMEKHDFEKRANNDA